jgi:hypothetical protein
MSQMRPNTYIFQVRPDAARGDDDLVFMANQQRVELLQRHVEK